MTSRQSQEVCRSGRGVPRTAPTSIGTRSPPRRSKHVLAGGGSKRPIGVVAEMTWGVNRFTGAFDQPGRPVLPPRPLVHLGRTEPFLGGGAGFVADAVGRLGVSRGVNDRGDVAACRERESGLAAQHGDAAVAAGPGCEVVSLAAGNVRVAGDLG